MSTSLVEAELEEMVYFGGEEERVGIKFSGWHSIFSDSYWTLKGYHWTV